MILNLIISFCEFLNQQKKIEAIINPKRLIIFVEEIERIERKEIFLQKAIVKHQNKFDYSKVDYFNSTTLVIFICNKHKIEFSQTPVKHLQNKHCCPLCAKEAYSKAVRITKEDFINKSAITL